MRIVNALLALCFLALIALYSAMTPPSLSGSHWSCRNVERGFTSKAFDDYFQITEHLILHFASDKSLTIFQEGEVQKTSESSQAYEFGIDAEYVQKDNNLAITFERIRWSEKPENARFFVNDIESLKGYSINYNYYIKNKQLYIYSADHAENLNYLCYSSQP
ncbi:hypothetical protein [Vibrio paucivorans]